MTVELIFLYFKDKNKALVQESSATAYFDPQKFEIKLLFSEYLDYLLFLTR